MINVNTLSRRRLLGTGAAIAAGLALPARLARAQADVIASATITPSDELVAGADFAKPGPYRIGFSNGFSGNTWRTECLASLRKEVEAQPDIAEFIVVDGQGDITKQVNDIADLIAQQVDAILCIPNSGSAVAPALRNATRAGIIAAPFNLPVDGDAWTTYVGTDPVNKGHGLGQWLRDALGGSGKIVALGGLPGNSYTAAAWQGAQDAMAGADIEVLAFRDAYWEEDRAKVVMADLIAAYPQIDGVWCDGAQVAAGAMAALLDAGRPLVPVTGDDYNGLLKLYHNHKDSQPRFQIGCISEPTWQGVVSLRGVLDLLRGQDVPRTQTIQPQIITGDNYMDYVRLDLPDGVFVDTDLSEEELRTLFS